MVRYGSFQAGWQAARTEAYAGLLLLVVGATTLAFARCPSRVVEVNARMATSELSTGRGRLPQSVAFGNAAVDGKAHGGWWVGHFIDGADMRRSSAVETKWVSHAGGKRHDGFATNAVGTSMAVLISGKHRVEFERSYVVLQTAGDYVMWGPGVAHSWTALQDSTILSIRWPSLSGDQHARNASAALST